MKTLNALLILSVLLLTISTSGINKFRTAFTDSFETMAHIAEEVENQVYSQLKLTTKELTLNLSGITFPGPARQGDNLNLTGLHIPGAAKCGDGYLLKDGSCQLADLLLMQDLGAQNLILGSLKLEQLKTKQQQFIQSNPNFTPLKCEGEKPYLSKQGCISCLDPHPYFNLETLKCAKCPEGSAYISEIRNCQKGASNFLSNFESKKYLVTEQKTLQKYKEQSNQRKESDSSLETCPQDRPYSIGAECVSCPLQKPLFFIPALICTKCRDGSTFDEETNLCVSEGGSSQVVTVSNETKTNETQQQQETNSKFGRQKWTVEKGLSNIFGWSRDETSGVVDKAKDIQNNNEATADSKSTRTVTATKTTTTTTNRSIRKQTDSQDEPDQDSAKTSTPTPTPTPAEDNNQESKTTQTGSQQNKDASSESNSSQTTTVKNVQVEPIEQKPADEGEAKTEERKQE